jgi:lipid-A-disaccharide synthase-like uncharacterized protein
VGQSTGLFIYFRNIVLIRRSQKEDQLKAAEEAAAAKSTGA